MEKEKSLQETFAPHNKCFGCGPSNEKGLRIRSFIEGEEGIALWRAEPYHQAFPGVLCGGIIGTLLDCHCNWTAAWHLMKRTGASSPPCTVTAEYAIKLRRPTPVSGLLSLRARIVDSTDDRAVVEGELACDEKIRATCRGVFVAVREGHPAHHRW